jgi:hypothetical protein
MDRSTESIEADLDHQQSPEGRRLVKAGRDNAYLFDRLLKETTTTFDPCLIAILIKANRFLYGRSLEPVACVVCGGVPVAVWKALGTDPKKTGVHCAAHKAAFHSVCEATYNCCEPYDPDRDYEWRSVEWHSLELE